MITATGRMIEDRLNRLTGDIHPITLTANYNFNGTISITTVALTNATITGTIAATGLVEYASDAAAVTGGLVTGDLYKTAGAVKIVL